MKKAYFFAGVSIFFWSTMATAAKLLLNSGYNGFGVLWASMLFAGTFLVLVNVFNGKIKLLKEYKLKDFLISVLIGLPGIFIYNSLYYLGADILPASQAFIVNYMWPIMSVVFACVILKEKMSFKKGVAIAVSFLGVGIVAGKDIASFNHNTLLGVGYCLLGAVSYGLFTVLNKKFHYDKSVSMMINCLVTLCLTTVINLINGGLFVPSLTEAIGFAWNGIFTVAVPCTTWALALDGGNTAKISNLAYITPFLSLVWSWLILGDKGIINLNSIIGLCVIVAGIFIQLIKFKKHEDKEKI